MTRFTITFNFTTDNTGPDDVATLAREVLTEGREALLDGEAFKFAGAHVDGEAVGVVMTLTTDEPMSVVEDWASEIAFNLNDGAWLPFNEANPFTVA